MPDNLDLQALRRLNAQRTPGEWLLDLDRPHSVVVADGGFVCGIVRNSSTNDARAIVAAVNAIGPLLERVEMLEPKAKAWQLLFDGLQRRGLEAENKRLLERVRELERRLSVSESECERQRS